MQFLLDVDGFVFICHLCRTHLKTKKVPLESAINGFRAVGLPSELKHFKVLEENFLTINIPFIHILENVSVGQFACKGGIFNVPNNFVHAIDAIPGNWAPTDLLCVAFKRRLQDKYPYLNSYVRS